MKTNSLCEVHDGDGHGSYRYVRAEKFVTEVCHLLDVLIHISELQFYLYGQCLDESNRDRNRKLHGDLVPLAMQIAEESNAALDIFGTP